MMRLIGLVAVLLPIETQAQDDAAEEPPKVIVRTEPRCTEAARNKGIQGPVQMRVDLDSKGRVSNIRIIRRLGYGLDEAAIECVTEWKFRPATRNRIAVSAAIPIEIDFRCTR